MSLRHRLEKDMLGLHLRNRALDLAETVFAFHLFCHCFLVKLSQCKKPGAASQWPVARRISCQFTETTKT
tara:strand:- start:508 stop:717 length:210 start_codon:yes stop_codon:yes gene_type:complete